MNRRLVAGGAWTWNIATDDLKSEIQKSDTGFWGLQDVPIIKLKK